MLQSLTDLVKQLEYQNERGTDLIALNLLEVIRLYLTTKINN